MKIVSVKSLAIPDIKVIRFVRFVDMRGYFTEHYRKSDFFKHPDMDSLKKVDFVQFNESFSKPNTIRGLHFQWNPYMGKLVRTVIGRMVDLVLDIRNGSPFFGKIIGYDMPANPANYDCEWIWVPPGFAHGNFFTQDTVIEYCCSGEYSQGCEAGVSPLANDLDWSLADKAIKGQFDEIASTTQLMTDKDRNGFSLNAWLSDPRSNNFIYGKL